jgi:glutamate N-acetyltransferase / amino-acid N-acetyltransferase
MKIIKGGITAPRGFTANGLYCGIKRSGRPDLSLIFSERPAAAAGVFTKNSIKAAPLIVCKDHLRNGQAQAIITNSGNANCFTGDLGLMYAKKTAELFAALLDIYPTDVLVSSTGIIGKPLPFQKIADAAVNLVKGLKKSGALLAARGIMTTDLFPKEVAAELKLGGKTVRIGACAKGSGMIQPNMATMLAYISTDAAISPKMLKAALKIAVDQTVNMITVDGCMSTNDMVAVLANGLAQNDPIQTEGKNFQFFTEALTAICLDLAKKIVLDGEGATKFVEITVKTARTFGQAKAAAMAIANSVLVKTALFGNNPNWGRVAAAVGSLGLPVTEKTIKITFSPFVKKNIRIVVDLNLGSTAATVYTCDLSYDYVKINGAYN